MPLLARFFQWNALGRATVFTLAASSIWCLLAEFYGLCSMQTFTLYVSIPALTLLMVMAFVNQSRGDGRLFQAVIVGGVCGLIAAISYDIFRLPFVFSKELGMTGFVPHLPLFKVFPRFGAMILGQDIEQDAYSAAAQVIGWLYHFSNGFTFGIMYAAMIGDPLRRSWLWAVVMAAGIELGMLFTPYSQLFAIKVAATFVVVTICAHMIFGIVLGTTLKKAYSKRGLVTP